MPELESVGDSVTSLGSLRGATCTLVETSYPNELVLGFGQLSMYRRRLQAQWMLFTRDSPWELETRRGLAAWSHGKTSQKALRTLQRDFLHSNVKSVDHGLSPIGITLTSDTAVFRLTPQVSEEHEVAWECRLPSEEVLRVYGDTTIERVESSAVVDEVRPADIQLLNEILEVAADGISEPADTQDTLSFRTLRTRVAIRRALIEAAARAGLRLYASAREGIEPDFVLLGQQGSMILFELKELSDGTTELMAIRTEEGRRTAEEIQIRSLRGLQQTLVGLAETA